MTNPAFTIPFALLMVVAAILAAVADQTSNTLDSDLNALLSLEVMSVRQIGLVGQNITLPVVNFQFFTGLFDMLTWNYSYFSGMWNLLRLVFTAVTFTIGMMLLISVGPVLIAFAEFVGRNAANIVGGAVGALSRLLFRR